MEEEYEGGIRIFDPQGAGHGPGVYKSVVEEAEVSGDIENVGYVRRDEGREVVCEKGYWDAHEYNMDNGQEGQEGDDDSVRIKNVGGAQDYDGGCDYAGEC